MTSLLKGWRRIDDQDGIAECVAPEGMETGAVRILERQRPLVTVEERVQRHLAELAAAGVSSLVAHPPTAITTREGEYGVTVRISGWRGLEVVERTLAIVQGDDFQTVMVGQCSGSEWSDRTHAVVRHIAHTLPLGLGELRYRRYLYQPPIDWLCREQGLTATWRPAGEPSRDASIVVLPARPLFQTQATAELDNLIRDDSFDGITFERQVTSTPIEVVGFTGTLAAVVGTLRGARDRCVLTAALQDSRFLYVLRLQTDAAHAVADERAFRDVVHSCVPLPAPEVAEVAVMAHWAM